MFDPKVNWLTDYSTGPPHVYTTNQAEGAYLNGSIVEKVSFEENDAHEPGMRGIVIGSMGPTDFEGRDNTYAYFVRWDDSKDRVIAVSSWKIKLVEGAANV